MTGAITRMLIFTLFFFVGAWTLTPAGYSYAGSLPKDQGQVQLADANAIETTEVEIYRNNEVRSDMRRMIELCRQFEEDLARADANNTTKVEVYRKDMGPGVVEYRREYRESNRYAGPTDESRTIELCRQLDESGSPVEPNETEVRIYRQYTVPDP